METKSLAAMRRNEVPYTNEELERAEWFAQIQEQMQGRQAQP